MNLTDQETFELRRLCDAVVDGSLTEAQKEKLSHWLDASLEARKFYIRSMALSASLHTYSSETLASAPDVAWVPSAPEPSSVWKWMAPLALAASLVLAFWVVDRNGSGSGVTPDTDVLVARLTASKDCVWGSGSGSVNPGDHLRSGQSFELAAGLVEITFDSGARVVLEGPSAIKVDSAWGLTLHRGTLKASVPPEAIGFRVSNPAVDVVDLGTEFTMLADPGGAADVLVMKGAVEAEPRGGTSQDSVMLYENESLRFTAYGTSEISDSERKFKHFHQPFSLKNFSPPPNYVHWSFDETEGGRFDSYAVGLPPVEHLAAIHDLTSEDLQQVHGKGPQGGALRFGGQHYAKAGFPGLSTNGARTVAFWVKVAPDTHLSEAYAMAAWLPSNDRLRFRPVHICWNRNPSEGAVGVLRVDYTRGFAVGTTPLRDRRWHHVAVVFVPGAEADTPLQVKLYLDGRFEGEGRPSPPGTRLDSTKSPEDYINEVRDTLWLGCRLGSDGARDNRFRGTIDELFVVDRELVPSEIVRLMNENTLDPTQIALGWSAPEDQPSLPQP